MFSIQNLCISLPHFTFESVTQLYVTHSTIQSYMQIHVILVSVLDWKHVQRKQRFEGSSTLLVAKQMR